jgi:hypothetical protein
MRKFAALAACALWLAMPAQAQIMPVTTQMLMPSPLGVVLMVGKWIYDSATRQEVYYIEVAGDGDSPQQARMNGFRLAVEQAIGTLISSETEVQNGRIKRDEIISYAAGFVDRFEIISEQTTARGVRVSMRVWVKKSALSDRLLNRTEQSGQVDGARASVQLQTLNQERAIGDALLQTVLNDFPRRAFDIELKPTDVVRQNRNAVMEINFRMTWNKDYLRSLWTALEATGIKTSRPVTTITLNSGTGWFGGFGGTARYDDAVKLQLLANRMMFGLPTVLVTIRGSAREVLFSSCYMYQELDNQEQGWVTRERFVSFYNSGAHVNGLMKLNGRIPIPVSADVLARAASVDMDVVLRDQCPNR